MADVTITKDTELEKALLKLDKELRAKGLAKAIRKGGNIIKKRARQLAPVGDPRHKPEKKPLRDTIAVVIREYSLAEGSYVLAVVGPTYPAGAHAHLLEPVPPANTEEGHRIVTKKLKIRTIENNSVSVQTGQSVDTGRRAEVKKFMAPAGDQTQRQQQEAIVKDLQDQIKKAGA